MVLPGAVRPSLPKQWPVSAVLTSFRLKDHNYLLCGSERVKQMLEMYSIRPELPLLACYSLMSWTQSQWPEEADRGTREEPGTESSINSSHKWTESEPKRISSSLEQPTDHKSWIRPY
jgi:hypothetical protein